MVRSLRWLQHMCCFFFFSSRRRHTRSLRDWSSDVCSSDLSSGFRTFFPRAFALQRWFAFGPFGWGVGRSEEHTSELQSRRDLVCRLLLEKKKKKQVNKTTAIKKQKYTRISNIGKYASERHQ